MKIFQVAITHDFDTKYQDGESATEYLRELLATPRPTFASLSAAQAFCEEDANAYFKEVDSLFPDEPATKTTDIAWTLDGKNSSVSGMLTTWEVIIFVIDLVETI